MPSEFRRGFVRILSNYTRLFITVAFGLLIVRLVLQAAGSEGWGLVALFGSTIGFAAMFEEIIRQSMIRELGEAHHSGDEARFRTTFNSALCISAGAAAAGLAVFALLFALAPHFNIGDMVRGARHLIAAKGLEAVAAIALAPLFNMYLVTERMVSYNFWVVMTDRVGDFAAAVAIVYIVPFDDPEDAIVAFAWITAAISISCATLRAVMIVVMDRRLVPRLREARRSTIHGILHVGGWNAAVVAAMNLHLRFDAIIVNLFFGLSANAVFGFAVQLTSYTRRLTVGVTDGLDAVSARVSAGARAGAVADLTRHSTRLHGLVAFPALFAIVVLTDPVLRLWLGDQISRRFDSPERAIAQAVLLIQILSIGIGVRSITDSWTRILYGAGFVRSYARLVVVGGLCNPVLAILLVLVLPTEMLKLAGPALAFALLMFAVHGVGLSIAAARALRVGIGTLLGPLLRPLLAATACAPIILFGQALVEHWNAWELVVVLSVYGVGYFISVLTFGITREERALVANAFARRLRRRGVRESGHHPREAAASAGESVPKNPAGEGIPARDWTGP